MVNRLIEISTNKWPVLRDLYSNRKDRSSSYNLLQVFINWKNKEPNFPLAIYSLNGDWETDGIFVAKVLGQVFFNTCEVTMEKLAEALNCLDPSESYLLAGYQKFVEPAVIQHFLNCGLERENYKPTPTVWFHITKEQAFQFIIDPPDGLRLKNLEECHAEQVNSVWPYRTSSSVEFVKILIRFNDSVGLFEGNNLLAWCLISPLGSLGILQVMEMHKRKGFGNLVVRYMAKLLAEKDIEVTAPVVLENISSRSLFEKLGFKIIDHVYWADKPANK